MKQKGVPWIQQIICSKFGAICDVVPAHILQLWLIAAKPMVKHRHGKNKHYPCLCSSEKMGCSACIVSAEHACSESATLG